MTTQRPGFMDRFSSRFIEVRSEREFKKGVASLCAGIPIDKWRQIASSNVSLLQLASPALLAKAKKANPNEAGLAYILGLPDDRLMMLINEAAPEHAAVLRDYPQFAGQVSHDLRGLIGGMTS